MLPNAGAVADFGSNANATYDTDARADVGANAGAGRALTLTAAGEVTYGCVGIPLAKSPPRCQPRLRLGTQGQ
eukprot:1998285-Lingulodinium_polyedra.AAC.1